MLEYDAKNKNKNDRSQFETSRTVDVIFKKNGKIRRTDKEL